MSLAEFLEEEVTGEELEEEPEGVLEETVYEAEAPRDTDVCYILSVSYSGKAGRALVKLYDPARGCIYFWYDNTGHKPYCLSDLPAESVRKLYHVVTHEGFDRVEEVIKYDPVSDSKVIMTKIVAKDPLSIGGGPKKAIRDLLPAAWEAHIKYHNCYIYDRGLIPGMPYKVVNGDLRPVKVKLEDVEKIRSLFENQPEEVKEALEEWLAILLSPAPSIKRVAVDIEVYSPIPERVPDPREAEHEVLCIAFSATDGLRKALLLKREGVEEGRGWPEGVEVKFFEDEKSMLIEAFKVMSTYPVVLTFNGDGFDLRYLWHRARRLGFAKNEVPIVLTRDSAMLTVGVHVDLYKLFYNRSIQVYAFNNRYREVTLDSVAETLMGLTKMQISKPVSELSYAELAAYCFRDADITLKLTTFQGDLLMKLLLLFMRISKLSLEDVSRLGISGWIRNMLYFEHRRRGFLIPRPEDIVRMKGQAATKAKIKGKKYLGAIVLEPKPGVHFDVLVLDFTSLYPSIIKAWNLSYEVINCPHEQCKSNVIPEAHHWVCLARRGLTSLIIGLLRDVRAYWFKPMSRAKDLSSDVRDWYSVVDRSLKVILNASYGVMGAEDFPLYCPPVAESITAIGRFIITKTIDKAKRLGMDVIYGDTDSIFVCRPSEGQVKELIDWCDRELKADLDVDKHYRYVALPSLKKNYLGVLDDGSVDIKGMMGKKRNTPPFIKSAFNDMIKRLSEVRNFEGFEEAKKAVREIVQNCYSKLKNRQYSLDELAFKIMLSKPVKSYEKTTPPHVKAAKLLMSRGREVKAGDIIAYVKTKDSLGVKPVQLARIDEIDFNNYLNHIKTAFEQVLESLGVSFDEVLGVSKLERFLLKPTAD
ncbi:MAG: DNA-directed DNA polymerase I [Candidatus Nezhaarchaeota archaeon]|nr:DNA-directed DNA polymerase I [Candidatus Nezhaarchaeota archaeon]